MLNPLLSCADAFWPFWPSPMEPITPTPATPAPEPEPRKTEAKSEHFVFRIPKPIAGVLITFSTLLVIFAVTQYIGREIREADKDIKTDLANLKDMPNRMERLERAFYDFVNASVDKDNFKRLLKEATTGEPTKLKVTFPVATDLLKTARARHIILQPKDIAELGLPVVDASFNYALIKTEGWNTASQFADYRSYINPEIFPVSIKEGEVDPNSPLWVGNTFKNVEWVIDDKQSVGDTYVDSVIIYNGGSLSLKHVRFDRCQFRIVQNEAGAKFLRALIAAGGPTMSL